MLSVDMCEGASDEGKQRDVLAKVFNWYLTRQICAPARIQLRSAILDRLEARTQKMAGQVDLYRTFCSVTSFRSRRHRMLFYLPRHIVHLRRTSLTYRYQPTDPSISGQHLHYHKDCS